MGTKLPRERAAIKFEARNPKFETNSNSKSSRTTNKEKTFEFQTFGFVSDFEIRISDLLIPQSFIALAWPG